MIEVVIVWDDQENTQEEVLCQEVWIQNGFLHLATRDHVRHIPTNNIKEYVTASKSATRTPFGTGFSSTPAARPTATADKHGRS